MYKGADILDVAFPHVGEVYVLGSVAPLANAHWSGPWDCAEFVSWCAYQAYRVIYAVRPPDPRTGESYSGWWYEDAGTRGRAVTVGLAMATPGAVLVRKPRGRAAGGHVAISKGDGSTVEAKDRNTGVAHVAHAAGRLWDVGVFLPGILYEDKQALPYSTPSHAMVLDDQFLHGAEVATVQRALLNAGVDPGGVDGFFGPLTHAAVSSYQAREGLVMDGYVGVDTARALGTPWPIKPSSEDISVFEAALARPLADVGPRDRALDLVADARPAHADPEGFGRATPVDLQFENEGRKVFAVPSGEQRFYVGVDVAYTDDMARRGLAQSSRELELLKLSGKFDRAAEERQIGKWAHFLWPTIMAESSGYYGRVNSYDRAAFTFGCYQFAAHTPGENLILLFRRLLALPGAELYFPDLGLRKNSAGFLTVHRIDPNGALTDLEVARVIRRPNGVSEKQIPDFMQYLNADPKAVDAAERTAAARLMLWCAEDDAPRREQMLLAVETAKRKLKATRESVSAFDGKDWRIALWVNDIRHQGRAKYPTIAAALKQQDPLAALSRLGAKQYDSRKELVGKLIRKLEAEEVLSGWSPDLS